VAVVIVAAVMLFDDYGLWRRASMEAENRRLLDVQAQAERRMVENELRIRNVGNPDSVEKAARERYNFRREGERLYIIKNNGSASVEAAGENQQGICTSTAVA